MSNSLSHREPLGGVAAYGSFCVDTWLKARDNRASMCSLFRRTRPVSRPNSYAVFLKVERHGRHGWFS